MTDITTEIAVGSARIPSLRAPHLGIGWGIGGRIKSCGRVVGELSRAYAYALELALVWPVGAWTQEQQQVPEPGLEGRDPNW